MGVVHLGSNHASNIGIGAQTLVAVAAGHCRPATRSLPSAWPLPIPDSLNHLAQVRVADASAGVVGVVESRMELQPAPGKEGLMILHSVVGPAKQATTFRSRCSARSQERHRPAKPSSPASAAPARRKRRGACSGDAGNQGWWSAEGAPTIGVALQEPAGRLGLGVS